MKKHASRKGRPEIPDTGPDLAAMINKVQQQLIVLEKKMDTMIGQSASRPAQRFEHAHSRPDVRQDNTYRERILHKAICADCKKECEVPFKPSGDRPVYCKACYAIRKNKSHFKENRSDRPREAVTIPAHYAERHLANEKPKAAKRRKSQSRKHK